MTQVITGPWGSPDFNPRTKPAPKLPNEFTLSEFLELPGCPKNFEIPEHSGMMKKAHYEFLWDAIREYGEEPDNHPPPPLLLFSWVVIDQLSVQLWANARRCGSLRAIHSTDTENELQRLHFLETPRHYPALALELEDMASMQAYWLIESGRKKEEEHIEEIEVLQDLAGQYHNGREKMRARRFRKFRKWVHSRRMEEAQLGFGWNGGAK